MGVSSEAVLAALRRAVEVSGVNVDVDDVIGRRKLELAIQNELQRERLICSGCGDLEWEPEE
ncbi:hypothetical protein [Brevundimonas sp.]|uniref:hypothetical protein n=1 Tax=Brevundimonas sp. TaxID=1871086 RepID=UPI002898FF88|nr:hypothetical protein [Brevundimonas sp.]